MYTVTVTAKQIDNSFTGDASFRTKSIPPEINVEHTSSSSFTISWSLIPGVSSGFSIILDDNVEEAEIVKGTILTKTNLSPYTTYSVRVNGKTPEGDEYFSVIDVTTDPENPSISTDDISSNSLRGHGQNCWGSKFSMNYESAQRK